MPSLKTLLLSLLLVLIAFSSCKKDEKTDPVYHWQLSLFETDFEYKQISLTADNHIFIHGVKLSNNGLENILIQSGNDGASWEKLPGFDQEIQAAYWSGFCFITQNTALISSGRKFFKTGDGGQTWAITEVENDYFDRLLLHDGKVFSYGQGLLKYTADAGETWQTAGPDAFNAQTLSFFNKTTGFASSSNKLYKTTDAGKTWTLLDATPGTFVSLSFACPKNGIALFYEQPDPHAYPELQLCTTTSGGENWTIHPAASMAGMQLTPESTVYSVSVTEAIVGAVNGIFTGNFVIPGWQHTFIDTVYNGGLWISDIKAGENFLLAVGWGGTILTKQTN
jgi:photosystem II stability/assembly factor-like uncharacterized protein